MCVCVLRVPWQGLDRPTDLEPDPPGTHGGDPLRRGGQPSNITAVVFAGYLVVFVEQEDRQSFAVLHPILFDGEGWRGGGGEETPDISASPAV